MALVMGVMNAIRNLERRCSVITLRCRREDRGMTDEEEHWYYRACDALYALHRMTAHAGDRATSPFVLLSRLGKAELEAAKAAAHK